MNKDVLNIIATFTKPKLWLFWVNVDTRYNNFAKYSEVIEIDTKEKLYIEIFKRYIDYFLKKRYFKVNTTFVKRFSEMKNTSFDKNCYKCIYSTTNGDCCINHFPSLKQCNAIYFQEKLSITDHNQIILLIEMLIRDQKIVIKKLEW